MLKVGLTGNIGTGKSEVADIWAEMGAMVIDADLLARELLSPGTDTLSRVVEAFGEHVLDEGGSLDRKMLADIVFNDPRALAVLNAIVHPEVIRRIDELYEKERSGPGRLFVVEAALILESGRETAYDVIVVVDADREVCVDRVVTARGHARSEVERVAVSQMDPVLKKEKADYVIENNGSPADLRREAAKVYRTLLERAEES